MLINCKNYYNDNSFNEVCKELEKGETVEVYIDCIGHSRNNREQEIYKEALEEKYGSKLISKLNDGAFSFSYEYKLK